MRWRRRGSGPAAAPRGGCVRRAGACSRWASSARASRTCSRRRGASCCAPTTRCTFRQRPAGAREVREPQPLLEPTPGRRSRLAAGRSTTTSRCQPASSTRSCSWPSASACDWPSRRTAGARTPRGRSRVGAPGSVVRETAFVEIGPVTRVSRRHVRRAAAVSAAARRVGPRRALVGAGSGARLALGRRRRHPDPARPAPDRFVL